MHHDTPKTTQEAVELGLYLAITADCNEKSADALRLAKDLAIDLTEAEMMDAKSNVRRHIADERLHKEFTSETIDKMEADPVFAKKLADKIFNDNRYTAEGELT
tara:strand:+ start:303 stop:614 length:312 start_codon:yes stop_codon:yes gene_type:complete